MVLTLSTETWSLRLWFFLFSPGGPFCTPPPIFWLTEGVGCCARCGMVCVLSCCPPCFVAVAWFPYFGRFWFCMFQAALVLFLRLDLYFSTAKKHSLESVLSSLRARALPDSAGLFVDIVQPQLRLR